MTYRPTETSFGPPLTLRIPSLLYAALAVSAVVVVLIAEASPTHSWLYVNVVERGVRGLMSARLFAGCLVVGAVASLLYLVYTRAHQQWRRGKLPPLDWVWFVGLPLLSYLLLLLSGAVSAFPAGEASFCGMFGANPRVCL